MTRKPPDAWSTVLKLLAAGDKSEARLAVELERRGHSEEVRRDVISRARHLGYLNDARAAAVKARSALAEGKTPSKVRASLEAAGFSEAHAASAVTAALTAAGYDPREHARSLLVRSKKTGAAAARFLVSRGFDEELVRQVVTLPDEG